jgi:hypothetical protein
LAQNAWHKRLGTKEKSLVRDKALSTLGPFSLT